MTEDDILVAQFKCADRKMLKPHNSRSRMMHRGYEIMKRGNIVRPQLNPILSFGFPKHRNISVPRDEFMFKGITSSDDPKVYLKGDTE